jgi:hypothetical protein
VRERERERERNLLGVRGHILKGLAAELVTAGALRTQIYEIRSSRRQKYETHI